MVDKPTIVTTRIRIRILGAKPIFNGIQRPQVAGSLCAVHVVRELAGDTTVDGQNPALP